MEDKMDTTSAHPTMSLICLNDEGSPVVGNIRIDCLLQCSTLKNIIEDLELGDGSELPLPNMKASILKKIVEYMHYHADHPLSVTQKEKYNIDSIPEWDLAYVNIDDDTLEELYMSANYLDYPDLLNLCVKKYHLIFREIVDTVGHEHAAEEIGRRFQIECDIPDEQLAKIKLQNKFLFKALLQKKNNT